MEAGRRNGGRSAGEHDRRQARGGETVDDVQRAARRRRRTSTRQTRRTVAMCDGDRPIVRWHSPTQEMRRVLAVLLTLPNAWLTRSSAWDAA